MGNKGQNFAGIDTNSDLKKINMQTHTCTRRSIIGNVESSPLSLTLPIIKSRILAMLEASMLINSFPPKRM